MSGIIEEILIRRFGQPKMVVTNSFTARTWNVDNEPRRCELYYGLEWEAKWRSPHHQLKSLYGDSFAGLLLRDSLKIASFIEQEIWAVYRIDELQARPEVQRALTRDPTIDYFMDASNVWFYGYKNEALYCYDATFDELDCLGQAEPAINDVITQWLSAIPDCNEPASSQ
jgi:hypothetical protein